MHISKSHLLPTVVKYRWSGPCMIPCRRVFTHSCLVTFKYGLWFESGKLLLPDDYVFQGHASQSVDDLWRAEKKISGNRLCLRLYGGMSANMQFKITGMSWWNNFTHLGRSYKPDGTPDCKAVVRLSLFYAWNFWKVHWQNCGHGTTIISERDKIFIRSFLGTGVPLDPTCHIIWELLFWRCISWWLPIVWLKVKAMVDHSKCENGYHASDFGIWPVHSGRRSTWIKLLELPDQYKQFLSTMSSECDPAWRRWTRHRRILCRANKN